jgi:5-methylthioribose kinase
MSAEILPEGYKPLEVATLPAYLASVPKLAALLALDSDGGGADELVCDEIGDGNLNLVFIVRRRAGKNSPSPPPTTPADNSSKPAGWTPVIVKQALPWVRCIGESWPLPLSRAHFEHLALANENRLAEGLVPRVYHYDASMATIAMEFLDAPYIILRKGLLSGTRYPHLAEDIGAFLARTLYGTSAFALPHAEHRELLASFAGNTAMCALTHGVVFTDPYAGSEHNRHTEPELDDAAAGLASDTELKLAVARLKHRFATCAQAAIHGDLHTGSVMAAAGKADDGAAAAGGRLRARVIDPEFGFAGPMGFDTGAFVGNLLLCYFAHAGAGHGTGHGEAGYPAWLLATARGTWSHFADGFAAQWAAEGGAPAGDVPGRGMFAAAASGSEGAAGSSESARACAAVLAEVERDTLGFAGTLMIRRIVGVAHVEDLESIENQSIKARCELAAIAAARRLILESAAGTLTTVEAAVQVCAGVALEHKLPFP